MTRLCTAFVAALFAVGPAQATEIGDVISFEKPTIACIFFDDAKEALRLRTLHGLRRAQSFADRKRDNRGNYLCVTRDNPRYEWLVVRKNPQPNARSAWYCVEATADYDVHSPTERKAARAVLRPCFWVSTCPVDKLPQEQPTTPHSPKCK